MRTKLEAMLVSIASVSNSVGDLDTIFSDGYSIFYGMTYGNADKECSSEEGDFGKKD